LLLNVLPIEPASLPNRDRFGISQIQRTQAIILNTEVR
jgi:hypothetical protein